ncbi:hypothetical protein MVEG_10446 [Podila verticillata NRRL 6337]|nr:hypothetical protein MVEG_10446 [Podila verticillata NRRL 6337]
MRWICQGHILGTSNTEALEEYVRSQGGRIDLQLSTITVALNSLSQADTFTSTLLQSDRIFDLSLNLVWNLSTLDLEVFLQLVSRCGVSTLQIDGATLNFQQRLEYSRDPFARYLGVGTVRHRSGNLITLIRYPQSSESYTYFCRDSLVFGFLFSGIFNKLHVDWFTLGVNLVAFDSRFLETLKSSDQEQDALWTELTRIVKPLLAQGLKKVDVYDTYTFELQCRLGVEDGSITGITEFYEPSKLHIRWSRRISVLRRCIIRPSAYHVFESLYSFIKDTPELKSVDIPAQGHKVFVIITYLLRTWPVARIVQVTLVEYNSKDDGLPLVKLHIGVNRNKRSAMAIRIKEWNHDHVSEVTNSLSARVLALATKCPRTSLVSLALTISSLTGRGWKRMQRVLKRSHLEFLTIECGVFDPNLEHHLGQVLHSVNWSSLKSLDLTGDNINSWINIWAKYSNSNNLAPFEAQFFSLSIVGSGGQEQRLSHSSALWLHNVIYLFSPASVYLKNIEMQEAWDWNLIRGADTQDVFLD